jgi:hypothetical protein
MVKQPLPFAPNKPGAIPEQLVVRWCSKAGKSKSSDKEFDTLGNGTPQLGSDEGKSFTGLFIFQFDGEGRILGHTIEHVQEGGDWEHGVGAKFVGLTDWLLGEIRGRGKQGGDTPLPACQRVTKGSEL